MKTVRVVHDDQQQKAEQFTGPKGPATLQADREKMDERLK